LILITGASGLLGANLCRKLVNEGYFTVGLVHNRTNPITEDLLKYNNFRTWKADIRDNKALAELFDTYKITTIIHTVAHLPYTHNPDMHGVNVQGTGNLILQSKKNCIEQFVFISSISVYDLPLKYLPVDEKHPISYLTEYGKSKILAEYNCKSSFPNYLIFRCAGIYGQGMEEHRAIPKFIKQAKNNEPLILDGDGKHIRDFIYVQDVVYGIYQAWQSKATGIYNLGSGQKTSMIQLANQIKELTNSKSDIILSGKNKEQSFDYVLDISKAQKSFGFKPRNFQDGLSEYTNK
jgi:UDP-glucose 4-epimerase